MTSGVAQGEMSRVPIALYPHFTDEESESLRGWLTFASGNGDGRSVINTQPVFIPEHSIVNVQREAGTPSAVNLFYNFQSYATPF